MLFRAEHFQAKCAAVCRFENATKQGLTALSGSPDGAGHGTEEGNE
jgi:hypothetical protein